MSHIPCTNLYQLVRRIKNEQLHIVRKSDIFAMLKEIIIKCGILPFLGTSKM